MTAGAEFADPAWLLLLLTLPVFVALHHRRAGHGAVAVSRLPRPRRGTWRLHLPVYLRVAALAAATLALARPQLGTAWEESTTEGIDIQIALDVSGSMAAEDFAPSNRLEVAKRVVRDFIDRRSADRIGLTVFSGTSLTLAPLTADRRMLDELVASIRITEVPDGTALGVALASAASRLKSSEAESRIVVLVTDGVSNTGAIDPRSAAALAEGLGLRVYAVGVGRGGRVPVPQARRDPWTGRVFVERVPMEVEVDEELLREIARRTGGRFFRATEPAALDAVFAEIDQLERTPVAVRRLVRHEEAFQAFAWTALALTLLPLVAAAVRITAEP